MTSTVQSKQKKVRRVVLAAIRQSFAIGELEFRRGEMIPLEEFPEPYPGMLRDRINGNFVQLILGDD